MLMLSSFPSATVTRLIPLEDGARAELATDAAVVGEVPHGVLPVVFTATLLTYLNRARRVELFETLATIGRTRPLAWIALESPGLLAAAGGIDLGRPDGADTTYVLTLTHCHDGSRVVTPLARVDPYGRWIRSLDGAG